MNKHTVLNSKNIKQSILLLLGPIAYMVFYMICFFFLENRQVSEFYIVEMKLDHYIPFSEIFIIPYFLWFAYIALTVFTLAFIDKKGFLKLCITLGTGMTLFLLISYLIPNMQPLRPTSFIRDNIFVDLVKNLYSTDTCTNVFPSIHVYNSLVAALAISKCKTLQAKKPIIICSNILCSLIVLSTMFLKQHSVFDVLTAFALTAGMYCLVYILPAKSAENELLNEGV